MTAMRLGAMTAAEAAEHPEPEALAEALASPVNAKRLLDTVFIEAVLRALTRVGEHDLVFAVLERHSKAFRGTPGIVVAAAALVAALTSGVEAHLERALQHYERILRRDPGNLYLVGRMNADAFECAARLGEPERGYLALEHLLDFYTPGPLGRDLPPGFPVDDPRLSGLWTRPAQASLLEALAARRAASTRAKKNPKRRP